MRRAAAARGDRRGCAGSPVAELRRQVHRRPRCPCPALRCAASTRPPCSSTRCLTSVRPMPRPPCERSSDWSACANRSKMCGRNAGSMPAPWSFTEICTSPSREGRLQQDAAVRPARTCEALLIRLDSTCDSRTGVAVQLDRLLAAARRPAPGRARASARRAGLHRALDQRRPGCSFSGLTATLPCTMRETSSRSSIRRAMWSAWRPITSRAQFSVGGSDFVALHDVHRVADGRQRVAQLVRQHGQEFVLAPVGLLHRRVEARVLHGDGGAAGDFA